MGKVKELISNIKQHWHSPAEGNYVPYKEVVNIGVAGFGIHWASTLASAIGLSANNFIVGASIGLQPMHLQIMLILANLVGLPIAVFRGWLLDNHKLPGGKFIPILLRTPIPMVLISTIFVWLPYERWDYSTKVVVVWIMFVILAEVLGFYNESFTYLKQVVTPNAQECAHVMSISQVLYSNEPSITNLVIPTIAGLTWGLDNIWTYRIIYPGFTVVGLIVLFIFVPKLKKRSVKLILKYGKENIILPDEKIKEEIQDREINTIKERLQARNELKAYTKAVSVYRRVTLPYNDARNLIIQAENYTQLGEIEKLYEATVNNA